jgi:hypothetical protein
MKIRTGKLSGRQLDYVVEVIELNKAAAEGVKFKQWYYDGLIMGDQKPQPFSTEWMLAGPIIEREKINVGPARSSINWVSYILPPKGVVCAAGGDTALESAMRCYVESVLGDEVEVPEVITNG